MKTCKVTITSGNSKVSGELYTDLRDLIKKAWNSYKKRQKEAGNPDITYDTLYEEYKRLPGIKDVSKRLCWDFFWAIPQKDRNDWQDRAKESGINDTHIETAVKRIIKEVIMK